MNAVVNLAVSPPLPEGKASLLAQLTESLDAASLWWLSGYAAGLAGRAPVAHPEPIAHPAAGTRADGARLTIVYGSQTGNSKRLAERLAQQSGSAGVAEPPVSAPLFPLFLDLSGRRVLVVGGGWWVVGGGWWVVAAWPHARSSLCLKPALASASGHWCWVRTWRNFWSSSASNLFKVNSTRPGSTMPGWCWRPPMTIRSIDTLPLPRRSANSG